MNEEKKPDEIYCPNCAKPIKKEAVICPYCRVQIKELKVSTIPSPALSGKYSVAQERKLMFVPKAFISRFVGTGRYTQFYNLLITDRRIVAGRTGVDWVKALSRALQDDKKYSDLEPEQILQADKRNFAFYFSDLKDLELKGGVLGGAAYMVFRSVSGDSKKIFFDKKHYWEVEKVLREVAGNILK